MDINFADTKTAFENLSRKDLKNAAMLFNSFNYKTLIKHGPFLANLAIKLKLPIKGIIKRTIFKQFCGGENIDESLQKITQLWDYNIGSILDYAVEGAETEESFDNCTLNIIQTVKEASINHAIPFAVFKTTGIARFALLEKINANKNLTVNEIAEFTRAKNRFYSICKAAAENKIRIFVDAEESWIQKVIDDLTEEMMAKYNTQNAIVFNTVQMYRTDRLEYLTGLIKNSDFKVGLKIVRGAYMEKERERALQFNYPSPINLNKEATDLEYNAALKYCLNSIDKTSFCAGTHNENSTQLLISKMQTMGLKNNDDRIWFSQLLGMSDHISFNVSKNGYNVAKYVPFGPVASMLPYMARRAQENSSIAGQMGRELQLINSELKRRK